MKYLISDHPSFKSNYDNYAEKFNLLAKLLDEHQLDVLMLRDVTDTLAAVKEVCANVNAIESFTQGFFEGMEYFNTEVNPVPGNFQSIISSSIQYLESRILLREVEKKEKEKALHSPGEAQIMVQWRQAI